MPQALFLFKTNLEYRSLAVFCSEGAKRRIVWRLYRLPGFFCGLQTASNCEATNYSVTPLWYPCSRMGGVFISHLRNKRGCILDTLHMKIVHRLVKISSQMCLLVSLFLLAPMLTAAS